MPPATDPQPQAQPQTTAEPPRPMTRGDFLTYRPPLETERVDLPNGSAVFVKVMTAGERDRYGEKSADNPYQQATPRLIIATACDQAGAPLFNDDDAEDLGRLPGTFLEPIAAAAIRINHMGKYAVEQVQKK